MHPSLPDASFIRTTNLSKTYGETRALDAVSFEITKGSFTCIIGPTGCGKTTLLRILAGFIAPDSGTVVLEGRDITYMAPSWRGIGMVYQNLALFSHLTVFENVAFGLRARGLKTREIHQRVGEMLAAVQMGALAHRKPDTLSGGQQQRVALARALVIEPAILLLDEPFSALDKNVRTLMQDEVKALQAQTRTTTLLVTHDQEEALRLADNLIIMQQGRIVQEGPPRELYERPSSVFAAKFLGDANLLVGRLDRDIFTGELHLHLSPGLGYASASDEVTAMFRPEDVGLVEADAVPKPQINVKDGVVTEVKYTGSISNYRVRLKEAEVTLSITVLTPTGASPQVGEGVRVWIPPERIRIIREVKREDTRAKL